MQLLPLGHLAGMPAGGRASSGYLVQHGATTVMLDAGPGTAVELSRALGTSWPADRATAEPAPRPGSEPDAVVISHLHTDHVLDLLPIGKMLLNRRISLDPASGQTVLSERPPVPLYVPVGALSTLRAYAALFPVTSHPVLDRAFELGFEVIEYEPGQQVRIGGLTLRWELLSHASPNCGTRLEAADGASLVYTGDTGVTPALPRLAEGVQVLLSESTLRETDRSGHGHLSSADAARAAREAGAQALVLTHFSSPDPAEHEWHRTTAAGVFPGPVAVTEPHRATSLDDLVAGHHHDPRKVTA